MAGSAMDDCMIDCAKKGEPVALLTADGKVYRIVGGLAANKNEKLIAHMNHTVEITGDSMEPCYRDCDIIIISPATQPRRGDRVVVRLRTGEIVAKQLKRRSARRIELQPLNPSHPEQNLATEEVAWIARIVWASQ